ncbi:MAG: ABC transporter substrate-binding protein [Dehalococcoidia bacterium]
MVIRRTPKRVDTRSGFVLPLVILILALLSVSVVAPASAAVKIGALLPFTGPAALLAEDTFKAMQLRLEEIGWTVQGRKVELVKADTGFDPATGLRQARRLVERDRVDGYQLRMGAGTQDSWGIVVGTDDTAVTINDYAMGTQFTNALGASHQTQTFTAPAVAASTCSWTTTRTIVNNSGNPVSIKEIGIYIIGQNGETYNHCGVRDVLGAAVSVPDGGSITVTYTFSVTV